MKKQEINPRAFRKNYTLLVSGRLKPSRFSIEALFNAAYWFELRNEYDKKKTYYTKFIPKHNDHKGWFAVRTRIYELDGWRRDGQYQPAFKELKGMPLEGAPVIVAFEWYAAIIQCSLNLPGGIHDAIQYQRQMMALNLDDVPPEKVTVSGYEAAIVNKYKAGEDDGELRTLITEGLNYICLHRQYLFQIGRWNRIVAGFLGAIGELEQRRNNYLSAVFLQLGNLLTTSDQRAEATSAARIYFCLHKANRPYDPLVEPSLTVFKDKRGKLTPVDRDSIREEYAFADQKILGKHLDVLEKTYQI